MRYLSINERGDRFDFETQEWIVDVPLVNNCFRCLTEVPWNDYACLTCSEVLYD